MNNLLTKTDRKQQTIQYAYDALYRLTSKTLPNSRAVNYSYDLLSRLTQVTAPSGTYTFSYDNLGRLVGTGTRYPFLSGTLTNSYAYDAASNRTSLTDPADHPPFEFIALSKGSQIRRGGRGWRAAGNHPVAFGATPPKSGGELLRNSPPQMRRGGAPSDGVVLNRGLRGGADKGITGMR